MVASVPLPGHGAMLFDKCDDGLLRSAQPALTEVQLRSLWPEMPALLHCETSILTDAQRSDFASSVQPVPSAIGRSFRPLNHASK